MRKFFLVAAVVTSTLPVLAQNQPPTKPSSNVEILIAPMSCPGKLSATPTGISHELWTISMEDAKNSNTEKSGLGVSVNFQSPDNIRMKNRFVQEAVFSVSYLPTGLRLMSDATEKISKKTFSVKADSHDTRTLNADLMIGKAASIKTVHLVSVTYNDGTQWKSVSENVCSITPSRFLPVASK